MSVRCSDQPVEGKGIDEGLDCRTGGSGRHRHAQQVCDLVLRRPTVALVLLRWVEAECLAHVLLMDATPGPALNHPVIPLHDDGPLLVEHPDLDRKSTRLNSSH